MGSFRKLKHVPKLKKLWSGEKFNVGLADNKRLYSWGNVNWEESQ